jgi:D-beta-D-heptose 7-phosphate kinase/D-beta-D-heptose 1-phosphate adenosyltransferase
MSDLHRFTVNLDSLHTWESQHVLDDLRGNCVVANGCFDVLHPGHLHLLRYLHAFAGIRNARPVVALNSDRSIASLKGPSRPIVPEMARAELLTTLQWPFTVVIFDEDAPQRLMDLLQPIAVLKGAEYQPDSVVRWSGSEVVTVGMLPSWSTTDILEGRVEEGTGSR